MVLWSPAGMTWKEHSSLVFIGRPGQLHERSSYPCVLTNCLGLIRYMWPAGTASCLCRMTDMICSSALVPPPPPLQLPCCQRDPTAHVGPAGLGHTSPPRPVGLLTVEGTVWLDTETLEGHGDPGKLASEVSGHTISLPS
jgi:hypothetical protein